MIYDNIYYFKKICKIGGTEQFLYEIAKAYKDYDLTIMYDEADEYQVARISELVRCKRHIKGQKVQCKRAFFNFNIDAIDDIESIENYYGFVAHASFEHYGYHPPINHPKINHYFGVSPFACRKLEEFASKFMDMNIHCELIFNPLTLEPKEKVMHLVSACRLEDKVKGGGRTLELINALDRYCIEHNRHYIWHIFTNSISQPNSKNVVLMKPRVDVRPYIADADIVLQLSNDMETYCYTINEAWGYGVHTITTPLSVLKNLPIPQQANYILKYDCSNIDDVVRHIFEDELKPFTYIPPKSNWGSVLAKGKSTYERKYKMKVKLLTATFDTQSAKTLDKGTIMEVSNERGLRAIANGWAIEVDDEPMQEPKVEDAKQEPKEVKKAVRRTTKKK